MLILEIGSTYSPGAAKKDGWNIKVIDHPMRAELIKKYTGTGEKYSAYEIVDYSEDNEKFKNIEEVDFIWSGQPLDEIVSAHLLGILRPVYHVTILNIRRILSASFSQCQKFLLMMALLF